MAEISVDIVSFISGDYQNIQNPSYGCNSVTNTQNYTEIECYPNQNSETYTFWQFDSPNIPSSATITDVTCTVRVGVTPGGNVIEPTTLQLCTRADISYAKGDPSSHPFREDPINEEPIIIDNCGTWSVNELNNGVFLRVYGLNNSGANATIMFFGATLTIYYHTSSDPDYMIGEGAWYYKVNENNTSTWKEVYDIYYKTGSNWKKLDYMYQKCHDGIWRTVSMNHKLIMKADFQNSLACQFYLDNTTDSFTIRSGQGNITSTGLSLNANNSNNNTTFSAGIQLPSNTLSFFQTQQDIWFTCYVTFSGWTNTWRSASNNGFGSSLYTRDDTIHNFFEFNNPYSYSRPDTTIPNNSPRWAKFKLDTNGYMIAQLWENNSWVTCRQNTGETSKALWLHNFTYMGLHGNQGQGNMLISYFRVWNAEPINAEIGI